MPTVTKIVSREVLDAIALNPLHVVYFRDTTRPVKGDFVLFRTNPASFEVMTRVLDVAHAGVTPNVFQQNAYGIFCRTVERTQ